MKYPAALAAVLGATAFAAHAQDVIFFSRFAPGSRTRINEVTMTLLHQGSAADLHARTRRDPSASYGSRGRWQ